MDDKTRLGAVAEVRVTAWLLNEGWDVFTSVTGKSRFDLIAARDGLVLRVEVKSASTRTPNGGFPVSLRAIRSNRSGNHVRYLSPTDSDVVAIYLHPIETVCFFPTASLDGRNAITLHEVASPSDRRRNVISDYGTLRPGAVAEWTKATTLKVVDPQGSVGSNPTRSASGEGHFVPCGGGR